ncbi:hypothetical protein GGF32_006389, partial [Allomyces javanicus]
MSASRYDIYKYSYRPNFEDKYCQIDISAAIPILTGSQRLVMIEYAVLRVFEWIEDLWTKYPFEAPAVALTHAVA